MDELKYARGKEIRLKGHPQFDENWVKEHIAKDVALLNLGDLKVRDVERIQKHGRLDLLLVDEADEDDVKWYEVEVQLGPTDESHIIRTIEYWDEEQRRYPNRSHCAVLIAEDITNRFLNVVSLFNRCIPLIAIQMKAIQVGDSVLLHFTRVLDTVDRREEEEEGADKVPVNREELRNQTSEAAMKIIDACLEVLKQIDSRITPNYRQGFVGLALGGRASNFVVFYPRKPSFTRVKARPTVKDEWMQKLKNAGLQVWAGTTTIRFRLYDGDLDKNQGLVSALFRDCYEEYTK